MHAAPRLLRSRRGFQRGVKSLPRGGKQQQIPVLERKGPRDEGTDAGNVAHEALSPKRRGGFGDGVRAGAESLLEPCTAGQSASGREKSERRPVADPGFNRGPGRGRSPASRPFAAEERGLHRGERDRQSRDRVRRRVRAVTSSPQAQRFQPLVAPLAAPRPHCRDCDAQRPGHAALRHPLGKQQDAAGAQRYSVSASRKASKIRDFFRQEFFRALFLQFRFHGSGFVDAITGRRCARRKRRCRPRPASSTPCLSSQLEWCGGARVRVSARDQASRVR